MPTLTQQPIDPVCGTEDVRIKEEWGTIQVTGLLALGPEGQPYVVIPDLFMVKSLSPSDTPWTIRWSIEARDGMTVDSVSFRNPQGIVYPSSELPSGVTLLAETPPEPNQCQISLTNQVTVKEASFEYDLIVQIADPNGGPPIRAQVLTVDCADPMGKTLIKDPTIVVTKEPMG